jgi:outer membrane cobalamin receptor|tara:strand:- start:1189 stop:3336 length:2148 start_codon:yes stop_codon:yes gene_type:complete
MKKTLLIVFLSFIYGQGFDFSGKVISNSTLIPIADVNIFIQGTELGTASNEDGLFKFSEIQSSKYILIVSAIGYKDQYLEISLNRDLLDFSIQLEEESVLAKALSVVGRFPSKHIPYLTKNISNQDIIDNDYQTMSELFRNVGGVDVQMAHNNGRNANFSIRGSSDYKPGGYNNRVLVLLDGFQISMPYSGSIDWNGMPLDFLDRVEVVKGPVSSLYGQNSMGGIINLVTKNYSQEFLNSKVTLGSFNKKDINIGMNNIYNNISYTTLLQYKKGDGHRFNAQYEQNNFYTKIYNKEKEFSVSLMANRSLNGQPGFSVEERPTLISYRLSDRDSVYLQLFKKQNLNNNDNLVYSASINHFYTHYQDRGDTPEDESQDDTFYNDTSLNLRTEYQKLFNDKSYLIVGADIIVEESDISIYKDIYSNPMQLTAGVFVQNRLVLNKKLLLGVGLRVDYRLIDRGNIYSNKAFSNVSPKINLSYKQDSYSTWNFALSKGFRSPSLSEMFLQYASDYGLYTQGNPDLEPEQLYGLDIGYDRSNLSDISFSVDTFYYVYEDMIDFVYGLPVVARNRSDISSCGLETNINYKLNDNLSINAGYTYLRVNDLNDIDPILYRPKHKLVSGVKHTKGKVSNVISMRYQSEQDYQDFLSDDREYEGSEIRFPIKKLDALMLFNYIGSYQLLDSKILLKISNIFNVEYQLIQDYPMPGRLVSISYEKLF